MQWASKASANVERLHEFSARLNWSAAARIVKSLLGAPAALVTDPRGGDRLEEHDPGEVRRLLVGQYTMRYAIVEPTTYITRVWHAREVR